MNSAFAARRAGAPHIRVTYQGVDATGAACLSAPEGYGLPLAERVPTGRGWWCRPGARSGGHGVAGVVEQATHHFLRHVVVETGERR